MMMMDVCRWMDLSGSLLDVFCGFAFVGKEDIKKTREESSLSPLLEHTPHFFNKVRVSQNNNNNTSLVRHKNKRVVRREKRHTKKQIERP